MTTSSKSTWSPALVPAQFKSIAIFLCIINLLFATSCISVNLSGAKAKKAENIKVQAPNPPFEKAKSDTVDELWRNPTNGNTISYLSDCGDSSDPSLLAIEKGALAGLYPYTTVSSEDLWFDGRGARRSKVRGTVDGVPSMVDLLVYKRNNCIYILTYVGLEKHFSSDQAKFDQFMERFHAP